MKKILQQFKNFLYDNYKLNRRLEEQSILLAQPLIQEQRNRTSEILEDLSKSEFKVFSQWGDDGIIQFLVNYLEVAPKSFVEFGVQNYRESNTRFLLVNDNWSGLILDGSKDYIEFIRDEWYFWMFDLLAVDAFITKENINDLLKAQGYEGTIGILSIDIDGNDYWVWDAIEVVDPIIVIAEFNSVFGKERPLSVPYEPEFVRSKAHYSYLYFGASLAALCGLAEKKGYIFVGTNRHGNNAFFVKRGHEKQLKGLTAEEGFADSKFRESRAKEGGLSYLRGGDRLEALKGMPVVNTETGELETL